jgi:hypothetical protein
MAAFKAIHSREVSRQGRVMVLDSVTSVFASNAAMDKAAAVLSRGKA